MRTWTAVDTQCCICGIKGGAQYPFVINEQEKGEKKVGIEAQIIEIKRRFNKENEVLYSVCTRCQLLYILDDEREFFRYDFPEGELKPTKEDVAHLAIMEKLKAVNEKLSILQGEFEKCKADAVLEKEQAKALKQEEELKKEEKPKEE